ncbi:MAG: hybrid sensor histidine kinase/response regulator [Anaerolineae bacterium]|nr:hybrid sensor histidine kinase/response regulator [Anaerolineae bacterium]
MSKATSGFESELRVAPKPVLAAVWILSMLFFLAADILRCPNEILQRVELLYLLTCALATVGWLSDNWRPLAGRWFTVLAVLVMVHLANTCLTPSGSLALVQVSVPVVLAVPLISLPAATIVAVAESLLLVVVRYPVSRSDMYAVTGTLSAIWAMLGVMYVAYRPVIQLSKWLDEYFERAQSYLQEVQDRKVELEQALESSAQANRQLVLASERAVALRTLAEEAQKAKTAFVANVSHEFRTPLNIILGLVDLIVETPEIYDVLPSPKMREDLRVIYRNCEHLSGMIDDVLDLTRVETGRMALHKERIDLRNVIDSSVAAVRPLTEEKQLALKVAIPDNLPKIYCDRIRIKQVILNLVSNAARFTNKGGITIEIIQRDHDLLISVTDTGPGIAPEDIEQIFEPFWQGRNPLWRNEGGSGLGLSISRQFVNLHGGRMWVESKQGLGTSFFFTLPISGAVEHRVRPGHQIRDDWIWRERAFEAGRAISVDELVKPRVVICDESGALYPRFARLSADVEFVDTRDLAQARRELEVCPAHVVVLNEPASDHLWPLFDCLKRELPGTPLIGCSVPERTKRAIDAGALGYLIKPVTRADLEEAIQAVGKPVRRVLVVDDDPEALQLFSRMLHVYNRGLEIATALDGKRALEEMRRCLPDLVLLDVVMPEMDGWQMMELMSQDEAIADIPIFFISAQDPADQPLVSELFLATMNGELPLSKLLHCSLEVSKLLLQPEREPGLALA